MALPQANPEKAGFDAARLKAIDAMMKSRYLDTGRLPFSALLVSRGGEIAHNSLQGEARPGQALQHDAIYRIASMTKPITSIAFMQLVEEGRIALNDPVTKILPEWKNMGVFVSGGGEQPFMSKPLSRPMRFIDLLRHTSGLTYSFQERTPVDAAYRKAGFERLDGGDLENLIQSLAKIPLEFDPGTSWNYSVSTDVLGAIIQRMDDKPLDEVIRDRVTGRLGMDDTMFRLPKEKAGRLTDCYVFDPKLKMKMYDKGADSAWGRDIKYISGGGGLLSTVSDYHRFCQMLLNKGTWDGERIIGRKTLELMTANHLPGGGDLTQHSKALFSEAENAGAGFGLGFATTIDHAATATICSNGDFYWGGIFTTGFFVDPVEQMIMIFMTQLMPSSTYPIRRDIKSMIYAALT